MAKYVTLGSDNRATAFYDSTINGSAIPSTAIAITDALWAQWIANSAGLVYSGGALTAYVPPAPTITQLVAYANQKAQALLGVTRSYTAAGVTVRIDASQGTRTDLGDLAQWGAANTAATQPWVDDNSLVTQVTGAQYVALAPLVGAYALSVYAELATVILATQASPPTITATAQIDSASWPT